MKTRLIAGLIALAALHPAQAALQSGSIACSGELLINDSEMLTDIVCSGDLSLSDVLVTNPFSILLGAAGEMRLERVTLDAPVIRLISPDLFIGTGSIVNIGGMNGQPLFPITPRIDPSIDIIVNDDVNDDVAGGAVIIGGGGIHSPRPGSGGSISIGGGSIVLAGGSPAGSVVTFLPSIPEPSTWALLCAGLAILARRRRCPGSRV